jgi:hypothetical protein
MSTPSLSPRYSRAPHLMLLALLALPVHAQSSLGWVRLIGEPSNTNYLVSRWQLADGHLCLQWLPRHCKRE